MSKHETPVSRVGLLPHTCHNTEASSIAMRFWARSIGDRNPRYVSEAYQSQTGAPDFMAHPCWLYSVQDTAIDIGEPGLVPVIAGTRWTFLRPVVIGDRLHTIARLLGEKIKLGRHAGASMFQEIAVSYLDAHGNEVANAVSTLVRLAPEAARASSKHADWKRWRYTEDELLAIERGYDAEQVRGDVPLYWEDVALGATLPGIVRGPVSSEEVVLFAGATRPIPGSAAFTRQVAQGAAAFIHPRTGAYESYAAGLVDDESARQLGFPAAHDYGIDRISQMASLLTNWIGDAGRLVSLDARLLAPNMLGDTTWFAARVIDKQGLDTGSGMIEVEATGTNQRGEITVHGRASVALPRREPLAD